MMRILMSGSLLVFTILVNNCYATNNLVLTAVPNTETTLTHISDKAIRVVNNGTSNILLNSIDVAIPTSGQDKINYCSSDSQGCNYVSTCAVGSVLKNGESCLLWLEAKPTSNLSSNIAIPVTVLIDTKPGKHASVTKQFSINYNNLLYANSTSTSPLKTWDGEKVTYFEKSPSYMIKMMSYRGDLYVSNGWYCHFGNAIGFFKWNGSEWKDYPDLPIADLKHVYIDFTTIGSDLYAGGGFYADHSRNPLNYVAKWNADTSTWLPLATKNGDIGLNDGVQSIIHGSDQLKDVLFVGGKFTATNDGKTILNHIATFDTKTSKWAPLVASDGNIGLNGEVLCIAFIGDKLFVGGNFTATNDGKIVLNHIARWDMVNHQWYPLVASNGDIGLDDAPCDLLAIGTDLYVTGGFYGTGPGHRSFYGIAKWDSKNQQWFALQLGFDPDYYDNPYGPAGLDNLKVLASVGSDLYVNGYFTHDRNTVGTTIVKWTPATATWSYPKENAKLDNTWSKGLTVMPSLIIN